MPRLLLEVAIESAEDAVAACRAGADRFELCAALDVGGLTPSFGVLRHVRVAVDRPVFSMIRPRPGGFRYSEHELNVMRADIEAAVADGAAGVVFGALTREFRVDVSGCRSLISATAGREAVFHRAFDLTPDPFEALESIIALGFCRVLTSGQRPAASQPQAVELIGRLIERAAGRIEVLPGSGIRAENVRLLVEQARCTQIHGAFRSPISDQGLNERGIRFGFGVPGAGDRRSCTDEAQVRAMRVALDSLGGT
jgi:copper homeostasis protein